MPISLGPGEPEAGPWRVTPLVDLVRTLMIRPASPPSRPRIVAIDGRGAGGKTTLAERIRGAVAGAEVIHTDDIAWSHSRFGWDDLLLDGVLGPLHRGESVRFQPPAWARNGRAGHVTASGDAPLVIVEGVGASRRDFGPLIDAAVWLQSDMLEVERRRTARDGDDADTTRRARDWMAEEVPFLARDRPWERADVIVGSTKQLRYDVVCEVVVAPPISRSS